MIYNCVRCGYETKHKGHFLNHLHRKKICKSILEDISIEDIKIHYNLENSNTSKITSNNSNLLIFPSKKLKKTQKNVVNKQCSYCCKEFSRIDNLNRHLKKCKIKKANEKETNKSEKNKIEILEKHNTELLKAVEKLLIECSNNNKTTNNTNNHHNTNSNNTIHNTININNYGEEDTKYITQQFIVDLLKNKPFKAIPEMIKHTYFNKEHPENQNIRITNKKEPYVKIMKDNKWELQDRKNTITDLIDKQHIKISDEKVEKKIDHQCTTQEKINIVRCNDMYMEEEEDYMKRLYNESELVMLNNS
tara:strand:- start:99 stop:1013 length:915 start_codon:yes stop_codon:yes gene_type:complete